MNFINKPHYLIIFLTLVLVLLAFVGFLSFEIGFISLLIVTFLASYFLFLLKPSKNLTSEISYINECLSQKLPITEVSDELKELANNINDLLLKVAEYNSSKNNQSLSQAAIIDKSRFAKISDEFDEMRMQSTSITSAVTELAQTASEIMTKVSYTDRELAQVTISIKNTEGSAKVLKESSDSISEVTALINRITDQINLLSLNATIESARAGEAGKGFAVVANEIKTLATQTAEATGSIKKQIDELQNVSKEVVDILSGINQFIGTVSVSMSEVTESVKQQEEACNEISKNLTLNNSKIESLRNEFLDLESSSN